MGQILERGKRHRKQVAVRGSVVWMPDLVRGATKVSDRDLS